MPVAVALVSCPATVGGFMQPLRIRLERIVDLGTIVCFVGVDTDNQQRVTVHVDHRSSKKLPPAWDDGDVPELIEYEAERLTLRLDMVADDDCRPVRHD
jgi:hypothetical protein